MEMTACHLFCMGQVVPPSTGTTRACCTVSQVGEADRGQAGTYWMWFVRRTCEAGDIYQRGQQARQPASL